MTSRIAPKKPTWQEHIELMAGPRVDIYVGAKKTHYSLPKKIVCYYSTYFNRCFNGNFIEGETQKLVLDEDQNEEFVVLAHYMTMAQLPSTGAFTIPPGEDVDAVIGKCLDFVKYADKYDMAEASIAIYDCLHDSLEDFIAKSKKGYSKVLSNAVETIFRHTPKDCPLRALITQTIMSLEGPRNSGRVYLKEELTFPDFAIETLAQIRTKSTPGWKFTDPFSGRAVTA